MELPVYPSPVYVNPFRIAVDAFEQRKEQMTQGQRVYWFDSFWDEWDDTTHDGNGILEGYSIEREVDYDNRIQYINDIFLDDGELPDNPDEYLAKELRIMKAIAEAVDRTVENYPELKKDDPFVSSRQVRESIEEAMKDPGSFWKSFVIEFELGPGGHFDRIIRATFRMQDVE